MHLDRVVDAHAQHHGQAGDRGEGEGDAEEAGETERPDQSDGDDRQWEEAPAHVEQDEQDDDHDGERDAAEQEHPALQVVVDVLEQRRGPGGDDGGVVEVVLGGGLLDEGRRRALVIEWLIAVEAHDHLCVGRVGDEGAECDADLLLVVEDEELHPLGVFQGVRPLHGPLTGEGGGGVLSAGLLTCRGRVGADGPHEGAPGDARRDALLRPEGDDLAVDVLRVGEALAEVEHHPGVDDVLELVLLGAGVELCDELLHRGAVLGCEQVVHGLAVLHGEHDHHGLSAEEVLVADVVLVDAVRLVEVAALAGRELQLRDAEAERERDDQSDDGDEAGVLSAPHREPGPEALHVGDFLLGVDGRGERGESLDSDPLHV